MESVYIETSVVSYLVANPSRDPVTAWRQQLTREWWSNERGLFPANARADASHLAVATIREVDYLLTWNYRHSANAVVLHGLEKFLRTRGFSLPQVCTPEELMAE